jgi:DivIVA domain-containing protein
MELERKFIEKRDFSQARRGYDPAEVDRHLRAIAEAVDQVRLSSTAHQVPSIAGTAAARVETIVAAAEASAREMQENAEAEAKTVRARAELKAAERIQGADEMVAKLVARAELLQREVDDFVGRITGLRSAVDRIRAEFDAAAPTVKAAVESPVEDEPEPEPEAAPEPEPEAEAPVADTPQAGEGARLVALNMALSGTPREETARYLNENFDLDNQDELLDDVYARAGG